MPFDSMPINVAGFKFATIATWRPTSCSGSYASAMPATSVRCSEPRSIDIFISFFDLGTRSAVSTLAMRRSIFMKSSIEMRVSMGHKDATGSANGAVGSAGTVEGSTGVTEGSAGFAEGSDTGFSLASRRGHNASRCSTVRVPLIVNWQSLIDSSTAVVVSSNAPTRRRISRDDDGMTGLSRSAITRRASVAFHNTASSSACWPFLASAHGACDAMYSLVASAN